MLNLKLEGMLFKILSSDIIMDCLECTDATLRTTSKFVVDSVVKR